MADGDSVPVPLPVKTSDLKVRSLSAIVMLVVAGGALWLGGWFWIGFVWFLALVSAYEWKSLVRKFAKAKLQLYLWVLGGAIYIAAGAGTLVFLRGSEYVQVLFVLLMMVVGTDIGAYLFGRAIGGPKIAPRISPSKTWAGLVGGVFGAALFGFLIWLLTWYDRFGTFGPTSDFGSVVAESGWRFLLAGAVIAPVAQIGDFFESAMKRRAGVKDSGSLIPGHGGVLDRVDGLLAVACLVGILLALPL